MAKGLGTTQRALLIAAARQTIAEVERQVGRRALHVTPSILSMQQMLQDACKHGLLNARRDPRRGGRKRLKTNETARKMLDRWYNPSQVAASLEDRGLLLRLDIDVRDGRRTGFGSRRGFWLTGRGLAEAIRLGRLQSEVVNLMSLVENLSKANTPTSDGQNDGMTYIGALRISRGCLDYSDRRKKRSSY
jgi:hypothetical protein